MSDDDLLRRYRPAGPPPNLRARLMQAAGSASSTRLRDWLPALSAAVLIVLFAALSHGLHVSIDARLAALSKSVP